MTSKQFHFLYFAILCAALFTGCNYHFGVPGNARRFSIGSVDNKTVEPALASELKKSLHEQFNTSPAIASSKAKDLFILDAEITDLQTTSLARAEIREKKARDSNSDAYQAVLYKVTLIVKYTISTKDKKILHTGTVAGIANLPRMHDRNVSMQAACRQAANDAARLIANAAGDLELISK